MPKTKPITKRTTLLVERIKKVLAARAQEGWTFLSRRGLIETVLLLLTERNSRPLLFKRFFTHAHTQHRISLTATYAYTCLDKMVKRESHSSDHLTGGSHRRVGKYVHSFLCMFIGVGGTSNDKDFIGQIIFPITDSCRTELALNGRFK